MYMIGLLAYGEVTVNIGPIDELERLEKRTKSLHHDD
jgi:hypothetical protein